MDSPMRSNRRSVHFTAWSLADCFSPHSPPSSFLPRNELMAIRGPRAFSELPNGAQVSEPPYRFFLVEERARRRLLHIAKAIPNPKPANVRL